MIYSVSGKLKAVGLDYAVVAVGGVGYLCYCSTGTIASLPKLGEDVELLTHFYLKQEAVQLFGFASMQELELFKRLIGVSGVGPKGAMAVLSAVGCQRLTMAIVAGDAKQLKAPGIGAKTAQRIILELRDRLDESLLMPEVTGSVAAVGGIADHSLQAEAISALTALGYSRTDAASAVSKLEGFTSSEDIIKEALRRLAKL